MQACESEPELLLRRLFAVYTHRLPDDPVVIDAAAKTHTVYEQGFGSVTLDFSDYRMTGVRPQPNIRFAYPRGT